MLSSYPFILQLCGFSAQFCCLRRALVPKSVSDDPFFSSEYLAVRPCNRSAWRACALCGCCSSFHSPADGKLCPSSNHQSYWTPKYASSPNPLRFFIGNGDQRHSKSSSASTEGCTPFIEKEVSNSSWQSPQLQSKKKSKSAAINKSYCQTFQTLL